ncbi:hypothetical protein QFZ63_000016 [Streptomyces sp. B3I7]|uniref:hypothetical protein n=1 Tax=Streptomyces sp. B3I7 TaxID=3042269 RepID=UPI00277EF768|nr:hypothetical protein [Streptomyces sp. B3I7]MDQ0808302.1 hypothetical protein [Streptomyces sp. B3I7]
MHRNTAQAALTALRVERMADVTEQQGVSAAQAAAALGYRPALSLRRAACGSTPALGNPVVKILIGWCVVCVVWGEVL